MNEQTRNLPQEAIPRTSLVTKIATRYSVEPEKMLSTLKATAFKTSDPNKPITNEQMMALLIVSDQYGLNPFTKEIFAFPDKGGIVPVVSVDGWIRIINEHDAFDGVEFHDSEILTAKGAPEWTECVIYRKDRSHPIKIRERFVEVVRDTQPWRSHPSRMLRHKALIQCARVAFGFAGIYDEDEAERIRAAQAVDVTPPRTEPEKARPESRTASVVDRLKKAAPIDVETEPPADPPLVFGADDLSKDPAVSGARGEPEIVTDFKQSLYIIENTKDRDIAIEALDIARSCLTPEEVGRLTTIFKARFETES